MAPLSGFEQSPVAPLWSRLASFLYTHGKAVYNFQGLRAFKDKFDPVWDPRYLAYPGGLRLPRALTDVSALIAGGYRRISLRAWPATTSITIPANNSPNPVMTLKTRTLGCRFSNRTVRASKIGRNGSGLVCQTPIDSGMPSSAAENCEANARDLAFFSGRNQAPLGLIDAPEVRCLALLSWPHVPCDFPLSQRTRSPGPIPCEPVPEPGRHWRQCTASEAPLGRSPFGDPPRRELFQALEHSGMAERNET